MRDEDKSLDTSTNGISSLKSTSDTSENSTGPTYIDGSIAGDVLIPNGTMLLDAEYTRVGNDLVLEGADGHNVIVGGYFSQNEAATLVNDAGAQIRGTVASKLAGPIAPGQYAATDAGSLSQPIGTIDNAAGQITVTSVDGTVRIVGAGDPIFEGDVIVTGADGVLGIIFVDKSTMSMSENGRIVIDEMIYSPADYTGSQVFDIVQGAFVFTSGIIGKNDPDSVSVTTPVATIGIRGTKYAIDVADIGGETTVVLLEGAILLTNNAGQIIIDEIGFYSFIDSMNTIPMSPIFMPADQLQNLMGRAILSHPSRQSISPDEIKANLDGDRNNIDNLAEGLDDLETAAGGADVPVPVRNTDFNNILDSGIGGGVTRTANTVERTRITTDDDGGDGTNIPDNNTVVELELGEDPEAVLGQGTAPDPSPAPGEGDPQNIATEDADTLVGDGDDNTIDALGGDDTVDGLAGDDVLTGGGGNDTIDGGSGADLVFGGDGDDEISAGSGDDLIFGNDGDDFIIGNSGANFIFGGNGDDLIFGGADSDLITGDSGNDVIDGLSGDDVISAGLGDDIVVGGAGDDDISGGRGNDLILGGTGDDILNAGDGDDTVDGGAGIDRINAGKDDDTGIFVVGQGGDGEHYNGGSGSDVLEIRYSSADLNDPDVVGELRLLQKFVNDNADAVKNNGPEARFETLGLTVQNWESVTLVGDPLPNYTHLVSISDQTVAEDSVVTFDVIVDFDGESFANLTSLAIGGVPAGATITYADGVSAVDVNNVDIDQLSGIKIQLAGSSNADFTLTVTTSSSSPSGTQTLTDSGDFTVLAVTALGVSAAKSIVADIEEEDTGGSDDNVIHGSAGDDVILANKGVSVGENLIRNGEFETDTVSAGGWKVFSGSIDGWIATNSNGDEGKIEILKGSKAGTAANDRDNAVIELDSIGHHSNTTITQTVDLAKTGEFQLTFDFSGRDKPHGDGTETSEFSVLVNGEVVATYNPAKEWAEDTLNITLEAGENTISFAAGGSEDGYGALLDNIELKQYVSDAEIVYGKAGDDDITIANGDMVYGESGDDTITVDAVGGTGLIIVNGGADVDTLALHLTNAQLNSPEMLSDLFGLKDHSLASNGESLHFATLNMTVGQVENLVILGEDGNEVDLTSLVASGDGDHLAIVENTDQFGISIADVATAVPNTLKLFVAKGDADNTGEFEVTINGVYLGVYATDAVHTGTGEGEGEGEGTAPSGWDVVEITGISSTGANLLVEINPTSENSNILVSKVEMDGRDYSAITDADGGDVEGDHINLDVGEILEFEFDNPVRTESGKDDFNVNSEGKGTPYEDDPETEFDRIDLGAGEDWAVADTSVDDDLSLDLAGHQLKNVEHAVGGSGNDEITGNEDANLMAGGAGDDRILDIESIDIALGGSGDDTFVVDIDELEDDSFGDEIGYISVPDQVLAALSDDDGITYNMDELVTTGINGGSGSDTVHVESLSGDAISFGSNEIKGLHNIETLDFSDVVGEVSATLSAEDVISMTDEDNSLAIVIGDGDHISVEGEGVRSGETYELTTTEGIELTVRVESENEPVV